jgi:hypothetical protein
LTGNAFPPNEPAFQRRLFSTFYTPDDVPADKTEFENLLMKYGDRLGVLGDFTAKFILSDNDSLKKGWQQLSKEILTEFYKTAGLEIPSWVYLISIQDQLDNIIEVQKQGVRGFLQKIVNDTHARNYTSLINSTDREITRNTTFHSRLLFCIDKDLISFMRRKNGRFA